MNATEEMEHLRQGMRAAQENYEVLERRFQQMRNLRSSINGFYKLKAKKHRDRAILNRENHRLLQNAHRKTLKKLRNKDLGNRKLMAANARLRELEHSIRKRLPSENIQASFDKVLALIQLSGEYGLKRDADRAQVELFRIALALTQAQRRLSGASSASVPASVPALPRPESGPATHAQYGCSGAPVVAHEPWDDE